MDALPLTDPHVALIDAVRVLRPGGTFVACTSSRFNDPEISSVLPDWGQAFSFDAESAPALIADVFAIVDIPACRIIEWSRRGGR